MNNYRLLKVSAFAFVSFQLFIVSAQVCLKDIDTEKVKYKQVVNYLLHQEKQNIKCLEDMVPSCGINENTSQYFKQNKSYLLAKNSNQSFNDYIHMNAFEVYNSKKIKLGLVLNRCDSNGVKYTNDKHVNFSKGQIMYLKLGFLKGLYKMAVAFEILDIDTVNKSIVLSYLSGGKSSGKQVLTFAENKNGKPIVNHVSYYKSGKYIRDKFFYPFFHSKVTNEFHKNARLISLKQEKKKQ